VGPWTLPCGHRGGGGVGTELIDVVDIGGDGGETEECEEREGDKNLHESLPDLGKFYTRLEARATWMPTSNTGLSAMVLSRCGEGRMCPAYQEVTWN
jgi:hypothetical protein